MRGGGRRLRTLINISIKDVSEYIYTRNTPYVCGCVCCLESHGFTLEAGAKPSMGIMCGGGLGRSFTRLDQKHVTFQMKKYVVK